MVYGSIPFKDFKERINIIKELERMQKAMKKRIKIVQEDTYVYYEYKETLNN